MRWMRDDEIHKKRWNIYFFMLISSRAHMEFPTHHKNPQRVKTLKKIPRPRLSSGSIHLDN